MTMDIVTTLLVNTIVFSILFGLVLVFRKLLSGRISAVAQYALLTVVVLKLLIPFGFESAISPLGWFDRHSDLPEAVQSEAWQPEPYAYADTGQTPETNDSITPIVQTPLTNNADVQLSQTETAQISKPGTQTAPLHWSAWVCIVWLAGVLVMALWLVLGFRSIQRHIRYTKMEVPEHILAIFSACKKELGIKRPVRLVMQTKMPVPAVTGVIKPMLIVPDSLTNMAPPVLRNIFLHELTHYKNGDLIVIRVMNGLSCLYWFNPLVWLCFKLIRSDMETVCDQRCLRLLDRNAQSGYVNTVLHFAGLSSNKRLQAAIAITDGRTSIEKRIRDMFKKRRTSGAARILVVLVAAIMLITCLLTACQPTPEEEIVIGKGDNMLEEAIDATPLPESTQIIEKEQTEETSLTNMVLSEHWQDTLSENNVKIDIDADVYVPNVSAYPVYEVVPHFTDEALARKLIGVLAKDAVEVHNGFYAEPEDYERTILSLKKEKAELEAGKTGDDSITPIEDQIAAIDEHIKRVEQEYADSKNESDLVGQPLDFSFEGSHSQLETDTDIVKERILQFTATMEDGNKRTFVFQNRQENTMQHTYISCGDYDAYRSYETGELPSTEEAIKAAMDIINELDIGEFDFKYEQLKYALNENTGQLMDAPYAKQLIFAKSYSGIPVNQYSGVGNPACVTEDELVYNIVLRQEELCVTFNKDGMIGFSWDDPCAVLGTENENVAVISFVEARDIFNKQIMYSIYPHEDRETKIAINEARLGYMVIPEKDDLSSYRTIPVWDFIGPFCTDQEEIDELIAYGIDLTDPVSYLTINAIDGSIIDRDLGY